MDLFNIHSHFLRDVENTNCTTVFDLSGSEARFDRPNVFFSAGIHPWFIRTDKIDEQLADLRRVLESNDRIRAIGECGFDKLRGPNLDIQKYVFQQHVILANYFDYPLIIHCVKAWDELIESYKVLNASTPWIIHGFRGKVDLMLQLLKYNFYFSFGFKYNKHTLLQVPLNKIFLETDDLDISIKDVYNLVSRDLKIPIDYLISEIRQNVNIFYF